MGPNTNRLEPLVSEFELNCRKEWMSLQMVLDSHHPNNAIIILSKIDSYKLGWGCAI